MNRTIRILKFSLTAALVFLALKVCFEHWREFDADSINFSSVYQHPFLLLAIVLLVPLNWYLESLKWNLLAKINSSSKAWKDVLRGLSLSLITPNRIGEIAGRVAKSGDQSVQHNYAFIVGSLAQSCATLCFGLMGLLLSESALPALGLKINPAFTKLPFSIAILLILLLLCLLVSSNLHRLFRILPLPKAWKIHADGLSKIGLQEQGITLAISALRYVVFLSQFAMALLLFGAEASLYQLLPAICLTYLITAIVPASIIGELGVRESVAVLILAPFCSALVIIPATFLVWMLNLVIPALIGSGMWIPWRRKPDSIAAE